MAKTQADQTNPCLPTLLFLVGWASSPSLHAFNREEDRLEVVFSQ